MAHPLVEQLRFTRGEWLRGLSDVTPEEAVRQFAPMNTISWMVGHLAWQEQRYWLQRAQGITLAPELALYGNGAAPIVPPLDEMWQAWRLVTEAGDPFLDTLTSDSLCEYYVVDGKRITENAGTLMLRTTYHYWYHLGESQAVRQLLGHRNLPGFVGAIDRVPYSPAFGG